MRVEGDEATLGGGGASPLTPPTPPPRQGMFLVLVTNKQSNILEDLDTLRLMSKVVPEYCGVRRRQDKATCTQPLPLTHPWVALQVVDEDSVCRNAFELIFAFDEVRAALTGDASCSAHSAGSVPDAWACLASPGHFSGP